MGLDTRQSGCGRRNSSALVEISTLRDDGALCSWIVELPPLVAIWVPNKYTLLIMWAQCAALVLLNMYISSRSPHSEVGHIWLASMP